MSVEQILKAWKDPEYRESLSAAERSALPENPAGQIVLDDAQLAAAPGAAVLQLKTFNAVCMLTLSTCRALR